MTKSDVSFRKHLHTIVLLGNHLPRQCGIATFTTDLLNALVAESPLSSISVLAMNDIPEGYSYPDEVHFEINQNNITEYKLAADFLNIKQVDVVCVQHEYGIFGGRDGIFLLELLRNLRMPIVTTLHTVLQEPSPSEKKVLCELGQISDRLVVMNRMACDMLQDIYNIDKEKIEFIHHGIPDIPFIDPSYYKDELGMEGKKVILTFGLLSPGKGIRYMIEALPKIVEKYPETLYVVLGATHPSVKKHQGDNYRLTLQQLAREQGIYDHIMFHNRFVEMDELCKFLGATDIYVTPYLNENQIVSGTLAYALGTGKATISTPYWYAKEMLKEGRGRLVPFRDSDTLASETIRLFDNDTERHAMRKRAYIYCREMIWKEVARRYLDVFKSVKMERTKKPKTNFKIKARQEAQFTLPEINLNHLQLLTDDTGMFQHCRFTVPDRTHGYCTDDNARALVVVMLSQKLVLNNAPLHSLACKYLSFLDYAFNESTGHFRNFMSYDRKWIDSQVFADSHGRALWALGETIAFSDSDNLVGMALKLFEYSMTGMETITSPRALAIGLLGINAYLRMFSGDSTAQRLRKLLSERLYNQYEANSTDDWPWLEDTLSYANGQISHALLLSGRQMQNKNMVKAGFKSLEWLVEIQKDPAGHFIPIGSNGWYSKGGQRARFDQQPIEAQAMIDACVEAHNMTGDEKWAIETQRYFDWFLGKNDLHIRLYDDISGGCLDGLHPDRANQNQGAESTLSWLLSLLRIYEHKAERSLATPGKPTPGWIAKKAL
ncbi:glycosyltransferase family 4 protein [candidate division KSB1 bacterium]